MNGLDTLRGLTLLIGRSPGTDNLLVGASIGGKSLAANVPGINNVPHTVSRCKVAESKAHAKLTIGSDGVMTLMNGNVENFTYVGSTAISTKRVGETDIIAMGRDRFTVPLQKILATAIALAAKGTPQGPKPQPGPPQPLSISHLEQVWNDYQTKIDNIYKKQQIVMRMRMITYPLTLISSAVSMIAQSNHKDWSAVSWCFTGVIIILALYNAFRKDTSNDERKAAKDKLVDDYVCPNPQCGHYLNEQPYKVIRQNKGCPYCKVPWTTDA